MYEENIIMALKEGVVPPKGVKSLCIGRDEEIAEIERLLSKINKDKKAVVKFVNGEFGTGKSFFLKVIEEIAFDNNFVVSRISLGNNIPFNRIDIVYKNIVRKLRCKTGESLEHIINRWIMGLKSMAVDEYPDNIQKQNNYIEESFVEDLALTREHAGTFATVIENYHRLTIEKDYNTAKAAQAWLRGDLNIPASQKNKFGVKGEITKENALNFLEALAIFVKSVGYSGLVVLIDEMEYIRTLTRSDLRDTAYNYVRDIYDNCNNGEFQSVLFIFAGTPELFDDRRKGIPSYEALNDRIKDKLNLKFKDVRQPIFNLEGFKKQNLIDVSHKIIELHAKVYDWNNLDMIYDSITAIVDKYVSEASLTGGVVIPREYIRSFVTILDTVQQNSDNFKNSADVIALITGKKKKKIQKDLFDDW